jgi:hypothetical protein
MLSIFRKEKLNVGILSGSVLNEGEPFVFSLDFDSSDTRAKPLSHFLQLQRETQ